MTPQSFAKPVSLKEKIGQMLIVGFKGMTLKPTDAIVQAILAQHVGGVILFDYDFQTKTFDHNIKNPKQLKNLTNSLQSYATQAAKNHQNDLIPLLISIDYEGGSVNRLKENYGFPQTISAEEIGQSPKEIAMQYANKMAQTLKEAGISINFAPVVDVNINPENPVIGKLKRSFSHNPKKVAALAAIFSKSFYQHGVLCAYKHFPGHGSSTQDTHAGFVDVTATWKDSELKPYRELLSKKYACPIVMTAHVVNRKLDPHGNPASLSYAMTTTLLRNTIKFDGLVVTDDLQMKAITEHYRIADAVRLAINAGADLLIFGNQLVPIPQDPKSLIELIYRDVKSGKISEARINEAYQRIIKLKQQLRENQLDQN